jgi:integrase
MPAYSFTRDDILTQNEVRTMIEQADEPWLKALISALYIYGARIIELLKLKSSDFWWEEDGKYLVVHLGVKKRREKGAFKAYSHDLRVNRDTPFLSYLTNYLATIPKDSPLWDTTIYSPWVVWNEIKKLNPNCSPHIFRHTRATLLTRKGASPIELMEWMGWKSVAMTDTYIHRDGRFARNLSDKID